MNTLELALSEMRNATYVSRTEHTSTWHWRSLELTVYFNEDNKPIKIKGTNRKSDYPHILHHGVLYKKGDYHIDENNVVWIMVDYKDNIKNGIKSGTYYFERGD